LTLYLANDILGIETVKPHGGLRETEHVIKKISEHWQKKLVEWNNFDCENFKVKLKEKSGGPYLFTHLSNSDFWKIFLLRKICTKPSGKAL
jgi:hypothetical protein